MKEIEIKVRVEAADHERIAEVLAEYYVGESYETDTYFTSAHRDFIESEECLRVRESSEKVELTWKPPTDAAMRSSDQFWKEELNVAIVSSPAILKRLLQNVDFLTYSTVKKTRKTFQLDEVTTVVLDYVETAGCFVEVETFATTTELALEKNRAIARRLMIDGREVVKIPYRDLVTRESPPTLQRGGAA